MFAVLVFTPSIVVLGPFPREEDARRFCGERLSRLDEDAYAIKPVADPHAARLDGIPEYAYV